MKAAMPLVPALALPTKVELVVNAAAARDLAITLPQSVLSRANEVIR